MRPAELAAGSPQTPGAKTEPEPQVSKSHAGGSAVGRGEKLSRELVSKLLLMEKELRQQEAQFARKARLLTRGDKHHSTQDASSGTRGRRVPRVSLLRGDSLAKEANPGSARGGRRLSGRGVFELPFLQIRRGLANRSLDSYEQKLKEHMSRSYFGIDKKNIAIIKVKEPRLKLGVKKLADDSAANLSLDRDCSDRDLQAFVRTADRLSRKPPNTAVRRAGAGKQSQGHKRDGLRTVLGCGDTLECYSASQFAVKELTLHIAPAKKPPLQSAKERPSPESKRLRRDPNPKAPSRKSAERPARPKPFISILPLQEKAKAALLKSRTLEQARRLPPGLSSSSVDPGGPQEALAAGPAGAQPLGDRNFTLCSWRAEPSLDESFRATENV